MREKVWKKKYYRQRFLSEWLLFQNSWYVCVFFFFLNQASATITDRKAAYFITPFFSLQLDLIKFKYNQVIAKHVGHI